MHSVKGECCSAHLFILIIMCIFYFDHHLYKSLNIIKKENNSMSILMIVVIVALIVGFLILSQKQRDADRDCLLHEAGIKVIRYPSRPDFQQVQRDFNL